MHKSPTKPISIRLGHGEIEQLQARAHGLSSTVTAVARHMIRTCLEQGDNRTLARRVMQMERRMATLEQATLENNSLLQTPAGHRNRSPKTGPYNSQTKRIGRSKNPKTQDKYEPAGTV